ncbi:hypothetical protein [Exiguobacterium antarcticum]|uniref:hypothetical protein n=1 Tax=Exiguobacterium antarcticum TaxID=132920 RepID=UPI003B8A6879
MIDLKQPNYYQDVKQFHQTFRHPGAERPTPIPLERGIKRATWTVEEAAVEFLHQSSRDEKEFLAAIEVLKAGIDRAVEKSLNETYPTNEVEQLVGQGDALTDALYFIMGSFVEAGLEPGPLFEIVQQANMAKLGPDGQPIFRESDQKVMKPAGWLPPEPQLEAEVLRQMQEKA